MLLAGTGGVFSRKSLCLHIHVIERVHGDLVIKDINSIDRFVFRTAKVYINGLLHVCEDVTMKEDNTTVKIHLLVSIKRQYSEEFLSFKKAYHLTERHENVSGSLDNKTLMSEKKMSQLFIKSKGGKNFPQLFECAKMTITPKISIDNGDLVVHGKTVLKGVPDNIMLTPGSGAGLVSRAFIGDTSKHQVSVQGISLQVEEESSMTIEDPTICGHYQVHYMFCLTFMLSKLWLMNASVMSLRQTTLTALVLGSHLQVVASVVFLL
ncbi:hypothetical protein DCAR_0310291 [Daucus carota subsp. sativus]|uniref:Uncharacterized protein n=1 Tax=Daucus carota subsp. sativus TaxID=79200 RepID=A0A165ZRS9_DAUCS|nr:hypothetical protein DCAR_0310291 [Daucus carota subsp. sativus]